jgi:hypothetical protein
MHRRMHGREYKIPGGRVPRARERGGFIDLGGAGLITSGFPGSSPSAKESPCDIPVMN